MLNRTRLILGGICLLYIAARIWRLTDSCLWFDEIFSIHAAEHSWDTIWWFVARDLIHPPLFYIILKFWIGLGGESVLWLRLLPVSFSIVALVPFVYLCRELKFRWPTVLLALGLLAVNGALIKYTQTLRMYSMLMCLGLLSMWLCARYFHRGKSFVPLVIANILLVYTHYFGWLVIATEVAVILSFQPIKWRRALVMFGVVMATFLPWVAAAWQAASSGSSLAQNIGWQTRPRLGELLTFVIDLVEPFYFQTSSGEPSSIYAVSTPLLVIYAAAAAYFVMEWKREEEKQSVYLLLLFVVLPLTIAFSASWMLPHSIWGTRHLIIVLPPALVLISHSLLSSTVGLFRKITVGLVLVISVVALVTDARRDIPPQVWCAWNDVAHNIRTQEVGERRTTIYSFEDLVAYHLWFASRESEQVRVAVVQGMEGVADDKSYFLPRGFDEVKQMQVDEVTEEKIWIAFRTLKDGEDARVLSAFTRSGYNQCSGGMRRFGSTSLFWMKMTKSSERCE